MYLLRGRNVHQIFPHALAVLKQTGVERDSRNGPVLVSPEPVVTIYDRPTERVIFYPERDANPFFHFFESLWMLAGRRDVAYVSRFAKQMQSYSDDGRTFNGAYGYRWRHHFGGLDQLATIANALIKNPDCRRQVLGMWDPGADLGANSKDIPCNLLAHFQIATDGRLDMTVFNRSNDIIWGCYGANAVHFSVLHEVMARWIGVMVGVYRQVSDNWHAYLDVLKKVDGLAAPGTDPGPDPYATCEVQPYPIVNTDLKTWHQDLLMFMDEPGCVGFRDPFFRRVAVPLWHAFRAYKEISGVEGCAQALEILEQCKAKDWKKACAEWLQRRLDKRLSKTIGDYTGTSARPLGGQKI